MNVNECSFCKDVWNSDNLIGVEFDDIKILLCPECKEKFDSSFVYISKRATNGDVIKAMFQKYYQGILSYLDNTKWWNAPYKGDNNDDAGRNR